MEITKAEIEEIADRRFTRKHRRLLGGMVGFLVLFAGLGLGLHLESVWLGLATALPVVAGILIAGWFWSKAVNRYAKSLIEECEKNPTLTYVAEPIKEQTEIAKT